MRSAGFRDARGACWRQRLCLECNQSGLHSGVARELGKPASLRARLTRLVPALTRPANYLSRNVRLRGAGDYQFVTASSRVGSRTNFPFGFVALEHLGNGYPNRKCLCASRCTDPIMLLSRRKRRSRIKVLLTSRRNESAIFSVMAVQL